MHRLTRATLLALSICSSGPAFAVVDIFEADLAGFTAAVGTSAVAQDFDSLSGNIAGSTIGGVTFSSPSGNSLEVVIGASTVTDPAGFAPGTVPTPDDNKLLPTSGRLILSPGGTALVPGSALGEQDGLVLDFTKAIRAFGVDVLFQSYDCCTFTGYQLFDASNNLLASGGLNGNGGGGGDPGASRFIGFVSDSANIKRIVFTESDGDATFPDSNIGYDTMRIAGAVPELATWTMLIGGFAAIGVAMRRARARVVFA